MIPNCYLVYERIKGKEEADWYLRNIFNDEQAAKSEANLVENVFDLGVPFETKIVEVSQIDPIVTKFFKGGKA